MEKARAYEKADRETLPKQLQDRLTDLEWWQKRVTYWQHKVDTIDPSEPWHQLARQRLQNSQEILFTIRADCAQLNRKLA